MCSNNFFCLEHHNVYMKAEINAVGKIAQSLYLLVYEAFLSLNMIDAVTFSLIRFLAVWSNWRR